MIQSHPGEFSAILVALFWTITALAFESASNKVGSLPVNIIRLILGFLFLSLLNLIIRGRFFPTDASAHNWIWLSFSLMAVKYTSSGIASTIMAIVPILIIPPSIFLFHHKITIREIVGTVLSVGGVALFFL